MNSRNTVLRSTVGKGAPTSSANPTTTAIGIATTALKSPAMTHSRGLAGVEDAPALWFISRVWKQ